VRHTTAIPALVNRFPQTGTGGGRRRIPRAQSPGTNARVPAARVLLVQTPFLRLTAPSIALATLQSALRRAGHHCDLEYLNLDFGRRIGVDRYTWFAVGSPPYLLAGDLVFAPSLNGTAASRDQVASLVANLGSRAEGGVPEWFVSDFEELASLAGEFLADHVRAIPWSGYDLVGLSTGFNVTPALALARLVKQVPGAPKLALGGCHCDGEMGGQLHRSYPFLDFVCRGEGEQFIVDLASSVRDGLPAPDDIPGLVWRRDGETVVDPRRASAVERRHEEFPLDALPAPDYDDWLREVRQTGLFADCELQLPIETSRGCWYGERRTCLFCGLNGDGITYRRKSAARILEDLRGVMGRGVRVFHCVDNVLDPAYFDDVLPGLAAINDGYEIFWPVRPTLTREQLSWLRRSGVYWIQVGIESLSTAILRLMRKGTTALQNIRLLRDAAELNLGTSWNVLFGFVGENPEEYDAMAALMPALSHLQPPRMSYQIRMDRFAPLFDERLGVKGVAPARAYDEVFPFPPGIAGRLAYYFDYAYTDQPDPFEYVGGCLDAMADWRRQVGRAALISFDSGSATHVCDSRAIAREHRTVLRGLARDVLKAGTRGIEVAGLDARLGASADRVEAALGDLVDRRWMALVDGRYLSLVVPADAWVPAGVPAAMVGESLENLYCRRMRLLCEASSGLRRPTSPDPVVAASSQSSRPCS
jgi:ribosomal peptide maturation radical SAM protein 1